MEIYRLEHPNPQWERNAWRCLNGEWEFEFDFGKSAIGIFTGNFENMTQVRIALADGGI